MKILGKTPGGFIVEMLGEELCKLRGHTYDSETSRPEVGCSYEISNVWHRLRKIGESKDKLSKYAKELRLYADLIEYKEPEINKEVGNDGTL